MEQQPTRDTPSPMRERRSQPRTITPLSVEAVTVDGGLRFPLKQETLRTTVLSALDEDGAFNDLTTIATVVSDRRARASLVARDTGVIAGLALALEACGGRAPGIAPGCFDGDGRACTGGEGMPVTDASDPLATLPA